MRTPDSEPVEIQLNRSYSRLSSIFQAVQMARISGVLRSNLASPSINDLPIRSERTVTVARSVHVLSPHCPSSLQASRQLLSCFCQWPHPSQLADTIELQTLPIPAKIACHFIDYCKLRYLIKASFCQLEDWTGWTVGLLKRSKPWTCSK